MAKELKDLKSGDPVVIEHWWSGSTDYRDAVVDKINGAHGGSIVVNGTKFAVSDGVVRGSNFRNSKLRIPEDVAKYRAQQVAERLYVRRCNELSERFKNYARCNHTEYQTIVAEAYARYCEPKGASEEAAS